MPPLIELSSSLSYDSQFQRHESHVTSKQPSIKRLQAEVRKLRAISEYNVAEAEENASFEIEEIRDQIDEQRFSLATAKISLGKARSELEAKEAFIRYNNKCIEKMEVETLEVEAEQQNLEQLLESSTQQLIEEKSKYKRSDELLRTLAESAEKLHREQEQMVAHTLKMGQQISTDHNLKISFLKRLMENEIKEKEESESILKNTRGDSSERTMLIDTMKEQLHIIHMIQNSHDPS